MEERTIQDGMSDDTAEYISSDEYYNPDGEWLAEDWTDIVVY